MSVDPSVPIHASGRTTFAGPPTGRTVAVMMSGGVDSAVTASLLKEKGLEPVAFTMRIPLAGRDQQWKDRDEDVLGLCKALEIPHYFLDTETIFRKAVIQHFRDSYLAGRTPNPCVECNRAIKFGILWETVARRFGIRRFATGHYARIVRQSERHLLARAADAKRDQSYFLYRIPPDRLSGLSLPLGEYTKAEVRRMAAERSLPVAERPDSMELCFSGEDDYRPLLGENLPDGRGPVVDTEGRILARHDGVWNFTIGQRRGLGFAAGEPRYVLRLLPESNTVVVGTREEASREEIRARAPAIFAPETLAPGTRLRGKIRSLSPLHPCTVLDADDPLLRVRFDTPRFGPTPGQHLVLYGENGLLLGGGEIV